MANRQSWHRYCFHILIIIFCYYQWSENQSYFLGRLGPFLALFLKTTSVRNIYRYINWGIHSFKNLLAKYDYPPHLYIFDSSMGWYRVCGNGLSGPRRMRQIVGSSPPVWTSKSTLDWLALMIMCLSRATCLLTDSSFSELAL